MHKLKNVESHSIEKITFLKKISFKGRLLVYGTLNQFLK